MDQTKCPRCGKRLKPLLSQDRRTESRCRLCGEVDGPRHTETKLSAEGPLAADQSPKTVLEPTDS
jgi:hypothetical protein